MWLFNVVREIFFINKYNVIPSKVPKYDKDFLEIYKSKSLSDQNELNKYVFKVHSSLKSNLLNSKILTTIRDPRDVCASFRDFMKSDFNRAILAAKNMIDFVKRYKSYKKDYLMFLKYEDIENDPVNMIINISKFIECQINFAKADIISKKFTKDNVKKLIKNIDKKIKEKQSINQSEIAYISKDNFRAFDINTGFQTNHISNRNSGDWKQVFSRKEIDIINSDVKINFFCAEYNYN